jgi:hypothetical protein
MKSTTKNNPGKVECINPNTGGRMKIDKEIYDLVSKAIYHSLKAGRALTFTEIVEGVSDCFKKQKTKFERSVGWYTVTVKNDMQSRGIIEIFAEKGKKLHRLKK